MKIKSEQELLDYASVFGQKLKSSLNQSPVVIELIGDVGVGKTTFVRGIAHALEIKEPITSPSFTISKSYAFDDDKILTHYDFYRLENPGLMLEDLEESINSSDITIIEWGNSVQNLLPKNRYQIKLNYADDDSREVIIL